MSDVNVEQCCLALRNARSDTEKFAALLLSTRLIRSAECSDYQRKQLFSSIGFDFVSRLLSTDESDVPTGCPPHIFRNLALNVYSSFCTVPDFVFNNSIHMVDKVPVFLKLLSTLNAQTSEEEISVKNDALRCLLTLASNPKSCLSLIEQDGMTKLCEIYAKDEIGADFREQLFCVISTCISQLGCACWERQAESFNTLMNTLCRRMLNAKTQQKFTMCDVITRVFSSFPPLLKDSCLTEKWYLDFHEELLGILCFKLGQSQREPLLKLCSAITEKLGVGWALNNFNNNVNYTSSSIEKPHRLFFLLVQLSCIEVRMVLEDPSFEQVMQNSELTAACFVVLEQTMKFLIEDDGQTIRQSSQLQLYAALTDALGAVLYFLHGTEQHFLPNSNGIEQVANDLEIQFIMAAVRVLGAWLAEETMALRDEVNRVLPFLFTLCRNEKFETCGFKCLHFLLPGLCHLVAEDPARKVMIKEKFPSILNEFMNGHWLTMKENMKDDATVEDISIYSGVKNDTETDLITGSSILLQIVVLEGEKVREDPTFMKVLRFVFTSLPHIDKRVSYLLLRGNLSVLGLLLLRHHAQHVSGTHEVTVYRYLSASIRFLWDAFNVEDSSDGASLVVNRIYRAVWDQVREMWYLGMQALSDLLPAMPWVGQFIVESGWAEEIVTMISRAKKTGLEGSVKAAYEDFLCCLVKTYDGAAENLKTSGVTDMCSVHKMKELSHLLRTVSQK